MRFRLRRDPQYTAVNIPAHGGRGARTITAAAQVLKAPKLPPLPMTALMGASREYGRQTEAWGYYDAVGELHSATGWMGNSLSRVTLVAAKITPGEDPVIVADGPAAQLVADFAGGANGQASFMNRAGQQLFVPGESYLVGIPSDVKGGPDRWQPCSSTELTWGTGDTWYLDDGTGRVQLPDNTVIIRAWQSHPQRAQWPDSSVMAAIPILRELVGLNDHTDAQIKSRLAGNGILVLPQSVTFPSGQGAQEGDDADGADPFVEDLIDAMMTPIQDRSSAAAVVPLVIKVPDDVVGKIQHLTFSTELDESMPDRIEAAITRLATALDLPPELLLGIGKANHWSAWQIDESGVRVHIVPPATIISHALSVGWLQPAMELLGDPDPGSWVVLPDTTGLTNRPDKSGAAQALGAAGALSQAAQRRENGFGEEDAPTPAEQQQALIMAILGAAPQLAPALLPMLGIKVDPALLPPVAGTSLAPSPAADAGQPLAPSPRALPQRPASPPDNAPSAPPVAAAALDVAVFRALELAGKRLLTRDLRATYQQVSPHELHTHVTVAERDLDRLLAGAWDHLPLTLPEYPGLAASADQYVRALLLTGEPHSRQSMSGFLGHLGVLCG
ncbi:hypothetical protein ACEZCY_14145 [Streptacidiphilus sp. N1-12]|uniref:Portal protein n=2 Tax=Streptacidiphilus alkalitolerans TaxID=3342712 RepID=A0ABV6V9V3_9ACTN